MAAASIYQAMYGDPETGLIPASFSVWTIPTSVTMLSGNLYDWVGPP
jgi:hypothetical protein